MSTSAEETIRAAVETFRTTRAARIRTARHPGLAKLPDEFLSCRQRHDLDEWPEEAQRWRIYQPGRKDPTDVVELRWTCHRCKSPLVVRIREDNGRLWRPSTYKYVPGYLVKGAGRPISRAEAKLEWTRRFLDRNPISVRQIAYLNERGRMLAEDPGGAAEPDG